MGSDECARRLEGSNLRAEVNEKTLRRSAQAMKFLGSWNKIHSP